MFAHIFNHPKLGQVLMMAGYEEANPAIFIYFVCSHEGVGLIGQDLRFMEGREDKRDETFQLMLKHPDKVFESVEKFDADFIQLMQSEGKTDDEATH